MRESLHAPEILRGILDCVIFSQVRSQRALCVILPGWDVMCNSRHRARTGERRAELKSTKPRGYLHLPSDEYSTSKKLP